MMEFTTGGSQAGTEGAVAADAASCGTSAAEALDGQLLWVAFE